MFHLLWISNDPTGFEEFGPILAQEGYRVSQAAPGRSAIDRLQAGDLDLVILSLHAFDAEAEFCRRLVSHVDQPLLLLLKVGDDVDRARGLDLGADDCLVNPIGMAEFIARVRALLRRSQPGAACSPTGFFVDGKLVVDLGRGEVRLDDKLVSLSPIEFQILRCLIQRVGEVLSHERLLGQVWGPGYTASRGTIKQHIHHLRQKLEPDPRRPRRIVTRRGEGYMLQRIAAAG